MPDTPASRIARLEERSQSILRELDRLGREVEAFGPVGGQLIEVIAEVRGLTEDVVALRDDVKTGRGMSMTLKVAIIAGSFALAGSIVVAVAQILSGS